MRSTLVLFATLILISCLGEKSPLTPSVIGTWKSVGHGMILEIRDSTDYAFYNINDISCLPSRKGNLNDIANSLELDKDTLSLLIGVTTYVFNRIDQMPQLCKAPIDTEKVNDPLFNFEVFAETVDEHYAFLDLNKINWQELYSQQKSKLNKSSTDAELYLIIEETLELLNDNHAFLEAPDAVYETIEKISPVEESREENELPEYGDLFVSKKVTDHHLLKDLTTKDSRWIQWGLLTETLGFIQIKTMWLYADIEIPQTLKDSLGFVDAFIETRHKLYEGEYIQKEVAGVSKIMDKVMDDLNNTEAIIIDIRFNGGGQDAVSFEILKRFSSQRQPIATQKYKYGDHHTPTQNVYLDGIKNAYPNPVYVLTSPKTGSAAETFSLSTMAMNNIIRIGDHTDGALSTTLDKTLPNGWVFSISNEVFMDLDGKFYENIGIPPDHKIDYPDDIQTFFRYILSDLDKDKRDILSAVEELSKQ